MANGRQFLGNLIKRLTGGALLPLAGGGAVSLADGTLSWAEPLTGDLNETWGLGLTPDCVVAYRLDDGTPGTGADEPVVVNLLRRDSGRRVQRLVVGASGPGRRVRVRPDGITVAGATGLWHLAGAGGDDGPADAPEGLGDGTH